MRRLITLAAERYGVRELTVNEQNPQAVGFYEHLGFSVWKRTERDEEGGEYPLLYMRKYAPARVWRAVSYLRMGIRCALRLSWLCQPATLAPREVFFCDVHAAAKNDQTLFAACEPRTL